MIHMLQEPVYLCVSILLSRCMENFNGAMTDSTSQGSMKIHDRMQRHTYERCPCPILHLMLEFAMWESISV